MKKILCFALLLLYIIGVDAQKTAVNGQVKIENLSVSHREGDLFISMNLDIAGLKLKSNNEVVLTPILCTETDTLRMNSVAVAGRNRHYLHLRNDDTPAERALYRLGETDRIAYHTRVPYSAWMEESLLALDESECGCRCQVLMDNQNLLATLSTPKFEPVFCWLPPQADSVKVRELRGQAYIDFPVSRTEIYENYRNNPVELQKIISTIDAVKNDPDTRITAIDIKGYASPESPYSNNTRLAKGRTETLKKYVQSLYHFADGLITTDYEPEDWAGLRAYVEQSSLPHKNEILALIDSDREPDNKEWKIKSTYPDEYKYLLQNCYPALRHSDYRVEYIVRSYTDIEEARRVAKTAPGKLSLQELYLVANSYEPGSEDYNETFETMVRLYPDDTVANLNAANAAMNRGDLDRAAKYLNKAGDGAEAVYARGVLAGFKGEYDAAEPLLKEALQKQIPGAADALQQIQKVRRQKETGIMINNN